MHSNRNFEIDLVRAVLTIAVIMIHAASFYPWYDKNFSWNGYFIYHQITSFAVPGFIFLSGLIIGKTQHKQTSSYFLFLRNKIYYIIIPYLFWSAIYYAYRQSPLTLSQLAFELATGKSFFHLYFVVIIAQLYTLSPIFLRAAKNLHPSSILFSYLIQILLVSLASKHASDIVKPLGAIPFYNWIFVFYAGCVAGLYYTKTMELAEKYFSAIIGIVAAIIVYKIGDYYFVVHHTSSARFWSYAQVQTQENFLYTILICLAILQIGHHASNKIFISAISKIAANSFGIYLCHMLFLRFFKLPFEYFSIQSSHFAVFLTTAACLLFSYLTTAGLRRVRYSEYMIGK